MTLDLTQKQAPIYYLHRNRNGAVELRQTRFKASFMAGDDHPHDVCAVSPDKETMLLMLDAVKISRSSVDLDLPLFDFI